MGPVFAFADFKVKWTFTGFDGSELGTESDEIDDESDGREDQRLKEEGEELAFHAGEKVRIGSEEVKEKV